MTDEYNKRTYRISAGKIAVCIATFAALGAVAAPYEIKISDGRPDAMYRLGETCRFRLTARDLATNDVSRGGIVKVKIDNFGERVFATREWDPAEEPVLEMSGTMKEPGFLRVVAMSAPRQAGALWALGKGNACWSVGFEPERIRPGSARPDGFDAYWDGEKVRLAREVPPDLRRERMDWLCDGGFDVWKVSVATFGDKRTWGFLVEPKDLSSGSLPLYVNVPGAGPALSEAGTRHFMKQGEIHLIVNVHPYEPAKDAAGQNELYKAQDAACAKKYGCNYAIAGGAVSREEFFFHDALLGIDRVVSWAVSLPEVDRGRVRYTGGSQGGGMGIALCALNPAIGRAVFQVPAMTDLCGFRAGRQSGWPLLVERQKTQAAKSAAEAIAPYFDAAHFAPRVRIPLRVEAGLSDTTCPPPCVYAAFNAFGSTDKKMVNSIGCGHGGSKENRAKLAAWLREDDSSCKVKMARETKLIAHGWDCQSAHPTDVLASADEFDKTALDGISLSVRFTNEEHGVVCSYKTMMTDPAWKWSDVEYLVPTLREIVKHRSLRESLLSSFRCPKPRLDWRDDAAWANFANNMRILARLAREGNVKGIMIDPEDYPRTRQFYLQDGDGPYDETVKMARRRGREVFTAVFEEKPDAVVMAFWLLSTDKHVYNSSDPAKAMRAGGCLFPAFMDGILDVLPPTALLVDGNEGTYRAEAPYGDHFADACRQRRNALDLISPENRDKYRVQHRVGAGFFLDGYWYPPENKWYMPPFDDSRAEWLGLNLAAAADAADYVWLDDEWRTYVRWKKSDAPGLHIGDHFLTRPSWDEIMPGFWKEVKAALNPLDVEYGRRVKVAGERPLTVRNPRSTTVTGVKYGEIYEVVGRPLAPRGSLRVDWKKDNAQKWAGRAAAVLLVDGRAIFRVPQGVDAFSVIYNPGCAKGESTDFSEMTVNRLEVLSDEERTLTAASDELYRYWRLITGDSHVVPVRLCVDPSVSKCGNDAYSIVTRGDVAVITGSNARSVLYGVYDLLERRGGCGWFWDGDRVPKKKSIDVSGLDVHEESKFAWRGIRYFAHRGLTRFQAEHWGFEEWKREIDWCLKKRLNLFMPRIGQDDIFQKAFPKVCAYPDASKPLPGQGGRYDNRSLFWPLEFRGELRRKVMTYAFRRGMMAPNDFGTMTHWYSRTPQDFLDKMKPAFLPQAPGSYGEPSGLVWDIRDRKWMDAYWRITDADIREYGRPGLLHTIGIAERRVSTNRTENLAMKTNLTKSLLSEAKRRHPESTRLLAGWDLYCMKDPKEVKAFLKNISEDVVIWDYEADASINTWFGEWDVVGKRPYVFGVFMAYEAGLDARTDYAKLAARQRLVADDPMCKGYILWPESSHVDSVGIEWFAKNAWRADAPDVASVVADYCERRYPEEARAMSDLWMKTIPVSTNMQNVWRWNAFLPILREMGEGLVKKQGRDRWPKAKPTDFFADLPAVVKTLKSLDWEKDEFLRRDMIDVARVWADRLAIDAENAMFGEYFKWLDGDEGAAKRFDALADAAYARLDALASLLALHTDFSVCDSYDRLAKVHPIAYSSFSSVLVDNIANYYCTSHQAELARHCYLPAFRHFVGLLKAKMSAGDRTPVKKGALEEFRARAMAMSVWALRLDEPRTREAFNRTLDAVQSAAGRESPLAD